jgi:hypothetical protein
MIYIFQIKMNDNILGATLHGRGLSGRNDLMC